MPGTHGVQACPRGEIQELGTYHPVLGGDGREVRGLREHGGGTPDSVGTGQRRVLKKNLLYSTGNSTQCSVVT